MMRKFALLPLVIAVSALPASAGVIVYSPGNNTSISSPFKLSAFSNWCGSQSVTTTGYSLDSSTSTTLFKSQTVDTSVSASTGGHTLHVKAWGSAGAVCVTDVSINVTSTSSGVPSDATSNSSLQTLSNWIKAHDSGTPGTSSGWMNIVSSPSMSGAARQFATSYTNYGGERYSVSFNDDASAHNFELDMWVYLQYPSNGVQILELDLNQVLSNGQTGRGGGRGGGGAGAGGGATSGGAAARPRPH